MLTTNPKEMDLVEIHDELKFSGIDRKFTRLDDARAFLTIQVKKGTVMANAAVKKDLGVQEEKQDNTKPATKSAKQAKQSKPKKEKPTYNFTETKWKGSVVFTSGGKATIEGYDETHKRFQVKLADGSLKDYAESAVRFKAVNDEYREKYVHDSSVRTESGSISIHTGDEISEAMLGLTEQEVRALAVENGFEEDYTTWQEKGLNIGMRRMNVGNMLRAKLRREEKVTIFGKTDLKEAAKIRQAQLAEERKKAEAEEEAKRKEREAKAKEKAAKKAEKEKAAKKAEKAKAKKAAKPAAKKASTQKKGK